MQSAFNFTMKTPKGDKTAGVVHVDLATIVNDKIECLEKDFVLEKCPVKESFVHMKIYKESI